MNVRTPLSIVPVCCLLVLAACGGATPEALPQPVPFEFERFCDAAGDPGPLEIPDDVTAVLDESDDHSADEVANALLTKAALELAHAAVDSGACMTTFQDGRSRFRATLRASENRLMRAGGFDASSDPDIAAVQARVTRSWRSDQSARGAYIELGTDDATGPPFWAQRLATAHAARTDGESTRYIESLLDEYDWIDNERFGDAVSAHAWILIQHADHRPDLQARVLERMEPYLESGGIRPSNYAYLWDRVAVNTGKEQRYGTQPTWECTDGKLELQPLENPETVDERRAALGMNTVQEGLDDMARDVCR